MKMKLVIFGGTFDPPHTGHILTAEYVKDRLEYDKVLFIPSFIPPHKENKSSSYPLLRLEMLSLAVRGLEWAEISDCEIKREGFSYSIDTVRFVREQRVLSGKPGLIIGDDLLKGFSGWKLPEELASEADLIIVRREPEGEINFPYHHIYLDNPRIHISSSEIRFAVKNGLPYEDWLDPEVGRYIKENKLYA